MNLSRDRLLRRGDYILGSFLKPEHVDGYINAVNPGDRSDLLGRFPFSARSVDDAVDAATTGAARWRRLGLMDRAAAVRRFRDQLQTHSEALSRLVCRENGKPIWEARQELAAAVRTIDLYLDDGMGLIAPRIIEEIGARTDHLPRGVVGLVCPYNLPVQLTVATSVAAVLCGNSVVIKPSKFTPGIGQAVVELWDRCKLPRGVVNLVQGSGSVVGARLVAHPGLDALVFVGGYDSAREVRRATVERPELPALFLTGGKGIALVLDDAEVDRAVYEILVGACLTTGQRHNSTARVILTEKAWNAVVPELVRRAGRLQVGYGLSADTFMGPVISENFRSRYKKYGRAVMAKGNRALIEADSVEVPGMRGNYVRPAIYEVDWRSGTAFLNEEPPGPMMLLYKVTDWQEAVHLHNQALYRLCASVFTRLDNPHLGEVKEGLRTGALNINRSTIGTSLRLPAVGLGRAGNGVVAGIDLLRVLTYPRAGITESRPFDASHLVPGVGWSDAAHVSEATVHDEDSDLGGALELSGE